MPLLLLIRHGENDYNKSGKLAGRTPGVHLNERGREQAEALAKSLAEVPIKAIYSSPLERAIETAEPIARVHKLEVRVEAGLLESDVGKWRGRSWESILPIKIRKTILFSPSRFRFPGGESFPEMQTRIVTALERIIQAHKKPKDIIAAVFHADPIKLAVAHFIGLPLDHFHRLSCETGSVTVLNVGEMGANLVKLNQRPLDGFGLKGRL
jgi:probable phosphomutase (TIGR03848 family)